MKVMVIVKATTSSETGTLPDKELLTAMGEYNQALIDAGIMKSGDGLRPSSEGYRIRFSKTDRTVTKGPFAETNELIAGYWVWEIDSMDEAIAWVKKCPNPMLEESDIEIRSFYEMADFAEIDNDGEIAEQEKRQQQSIVMHQAKASCYLFFSGRCEEALTYYQTHLDAKIGMMFRFNESPEPIPEGAIPANFDDKIMHSEFTIGDMKLLATDGCNDSVDEVNYSGFNLTLTIDSEQALRRIFAALSQDGQVRMPLAETFWSPLYGQVTDKFGIGWMLMLPTPSDN
ncbi:YciI family protein [Pseudoalteromonas haloplanktis]|uniref:YciI family protein n=1 Tax=Pseudoalteromonas haloplanktis TaxID=228 RepID=A0ABU1B739_PSEHA|nr:YciI family protein [Pseudoalteromonas haloplanktis]MDQ9090037.1 YciI family protein [Pseudoalteromonas haloplanktis]